MSSDKESVKAESPPPSPPSPGESASEPGYVFASHSRRMCWIFRQLSHPCPSQSQLAFVESWCVLLTAVHRKMFVGGLSWQTEKGESVSARVHGVWLMLSVAC